jgi:hypothetical protein
VRHSALRFSFDCQLRLHLCKRWHSVIDTGHILNNPSSNSFLERQGASSRYRNQWLSPNRSPYRNVRLVADSVSKTAGQCSCSAMQIRFLESHASWTLLAAVMRCVLGLAAPPVQPADCQNCSIMYGLIKSGSFSFSKRLRATAADFASKIRCLSVSTPNSI